MDATLVSSFKETHEVLSQSRSSCWVFAPRTSHHTPRTTMQTRGTKRKAEGKPKDDGDSPAAGGLSDNQSTPELPADKAFRGFSMPKERTDRAVAEMYERSFVFPWHDTSAKPPRGDGPYERFAHARDNKEVNEKRYGSVPSHEQMGLVFSSEAACVRYLIDVGIVTLSSETCDKCGSELDWKRKWIGTEQETAKKLHQDCFIRRCKCKKTSRSICSGTILEHVNREKNIWFHALYLWALDVPAQKCHEITGVNKNTSKLEGKDTSCSRIALFSP